MGRFTRGGERSFRGGRGLVELEGLEKGGVRKVIGVEGDVGRLDGGGDVG